MILKLDDTYRIISDKLNWVLQRYEDVMDRKTKEPTGVKQWKDVGYFGGNISNAIKKYVNEYIRDQGTLHIDELLSKLSLIEKQIDKVVRQQNIKLVGKGEE